MFILTSIIFVNIFCLLFQIPICTWSFLFFKLKKNVIPPDEIEFFGHVHLQGDGERQRLNKSGRVPGPGDEIGSN